MVRVPSSYSLQAVVPSGRELALPHTQMYQFPCHLLVSSTPAILISEDLAVVLLSLGVIYGLDMSSRRALPLPLKKTKAQIRHSLRLTTPQLCLSFATHFILQRRPRLATDPSAVFVSDVDEICVRVRSD